MADNQNISPDSKDAKLARLIGESLPNLNELTKIQDPLLSYLFSYKNSVTSQPVSIDSNALWDSIDSKINSSSKKGRILNLSPSIKRYAIAAAILVTALVASYMYQGFMSPYLVGESYAAAEIIELEDGSTITLRPYSKLYNIEQNETLAQYKLDGEAYFEVASNPNRVFSVLTDRSEVEVLGTKFILSNWGNTSSVYLQEGRVRYTSLSTNRAVELEPGESSVITENILIPDVTSANDQIYTDWLNNELVFQNESVEQVFHELNQHYNIQIRTQPDVENEVLSGTVGLENLSSVLRDFELVLNGSFEQTGSRSYVFTPNE